MRDTLDNDVAPDFVMAIGAFMDGIYRNDGDSFVKARRYAWKAATVEQMPQQFYDEENIRESDEINPIDTTTLPRFRDVEGGAVTSSLIEVLTCETDETEGEEIVLSETEDSQSITEGSSSFDETVSWVSSQESEDWTDEESQSMGSTSLESRNQREDGHMREPEQFLSRPPSNDSSERSRSNRGRIFSLESLLSEKWDGTPSKRISSKDAKDKEETTKVGSQLKATKHIANNIPETTNVLEDWSGRGSAIQKEKDLSRRKADDVEKQLAIIRNIVEGVKDTLRKEKTAEEEKQGSRGSEEENASVKSKKAETDPHDLGRGRERERSQRLDEILVIDDMISRIKGPMADRDRCRNLNQSRLREVNVTADLESSFIVPELKPELEPKARPGVAGSDPSGDTRRANITSKVRLPEKKSSRHNSLRISSSMHSRRINKDSLSHCQSQSSGKALSMHCRQIDKVDQHDAKGLSSPYVTDGCLPNPRLIKPEPDTMHTQTIHARDKASSAVDTDDELPSPTETKAKPSSMIKSALKSALSPARHHVSMKQRQASHQIDEDSRKFFKFFESVTSVDEPEEATGEKREGPPSPPTSDTQTPTHTNIKQPMKPYPSKTRAFWKKFKGKKRSFEQRRKRVEI